MLNFTHKTEKYMLDHLKKECLQLNNTEKKDQLVEMDFPWNPEEDIAVYFKNCTKIRSSWNKLA